MGIFLHLPKQNLSKANRNTTNPAARDVPIYPQKSFWTPYVLFWNFYDLPYQSISYLYCNIYHITVKHNQWYIILNQTTSVFFYIFFYILFCITYCLRDSWPRCLPRRLSATPLAPRSGWCRWSDWDWTRSWRSKPEHFTTRNRVQLSVEVVNTRN